MQNYTTTSLIFAIFLSLHYKLCDSPFCHMVWPFCFGTALFVTTHIVSKKIAGGIITIALQCDV